MSRIVKIVISYPEGTRDFDYECPDGLTNEAIVERMSALLDMNRVLEIKVVEPE